MKTRHGRASIRGGGACVLLALALVFASAGCSKTVTYTYVLVDVKIDMPTVPEDQRFQINSCEFHVTGAETSDVKSLRCPPNLVPYDVGSFEWATQVQTGTLHFVVQIRGPNLQVIGEGTSDPVTISPGRHLTTSVLVLGVPTSAPDGGAATDAGTDTGTDAGGDGSTPSDASTADGDTATTDAAPPDVAPDASGSDDALPDSTSDATLEASVPADGGAQASDTASEGPSDAGTGDATTDGNSDTIEGG